MIDAGVIDRIVAEELRETKRLIELDASAGYAAKRFTYFGRHRDGDEPAVWGARRGGPLGGRFCGGAGADRGRTADRSAASGQGVPPAAGAHVPARWPWTGSWCCGHPLTCTTPAVSGAPREGRACFGCPAREVS